MWSIPLWAHVPAECRAVIARETRLCAHPSRSVIFREGDVCAGLHIVASGQVRLSRSSGDREQPFAILREGEPLDIVPLLDNRPHAVTASARGKVELLLIEREVARDAIWRHPLVLAAALGLLSARLKDLASLAHGLASSDVTTRVGRLLVAQARAQGAPERGPIRLNLELSQSELAAFAGTAREVVSRSLKKLERNGLLRVEGRRITILDMDGLTTRLQGVH